MTDIDTQIEEWLADFELDVLKVHDMGRTAKQERAELTKAIKTLLIQQQGGLDKPSDTAKPSHNQADKSCVDCGKSLIRCEECTRLWQT